MNKTNQNRAKRRMEGVCISCGINPIATERSKCTCNECLDKRKKIRKLPRKLKKPICKNGLYQCQSCDRWLPDAQKIWGKQRTQCTRCHSLFKNYRITGKQYNEMFEQQNGYCNICKCTLSKNAHNFFSVDHNHSTGKIRGLLCAKCNTALGMIESSGLSVIDYCDNLIAYLDNAKCQTGEI